MIIIDCNKNKELTDELNDLLKQEYDTSQIDDKIVVNDEITTLIIESNLKKISRPKHRAFLIESKKILIVIPSDLRDIGMDYCEFCGYVGHTEDVDAHRSSHQEL